MAHNAAPLHHSTWPLLIEINGRGDYGETRYVGIGFLRSIIVATIFTEPNEETIRVVSLRKALKHEREQFEEYIANELGET